MKFATRMERVQASEIRELLKLTAQPDIISFAGGLPAPELFPVEEIAKVSHDLVLKEGRQLCNMQLPKAVRLCVQKLLNAWLINIILTLTPMTF